MKKILSLILCLMLSCSLVGCTSSEEESSDLRFRQFGDHIFMVIETDYNNMILVDITERTQYLYIDDPYGGGIELLVDSEGKPLLYEGEIPYERAE